MPTLDYPLIRSRITMQHVLELISFAPHQVSGPELRGPCPLHGSSGDTSRSFSVNVEKRVFRCFACGAHGNQLDLWASVRRQPLYEATLDLCDRLGQQPFVLSRSPDSKPAKPDHRVTEARHPMHAPPQGD